jgi:hypothetical protein
LERGESGFNRSILTLLVVGVFLFLSSGEASAQSETATSQAKPSILVASLPLEGSSDEGVRKVLDSSMRFQLERLGAQTLMFATTDEEALVQDLLGGQTADPEVLATSLVEFVAGLNHDFLALAGYIKEQEEIQVSFFVVDLGRGEILASTTQRAAIDFSLDEAMIETLSRILPQVQGRIEEVARRKAAEAAELAESRAGVDEAAAEREGEEQGVSESQPDQFPGMEPDKQERFRPFEFSIGFSPFVPVAVASRVFGLSFAPFVYGSYRIPLASGTLGLGVYTGLNVFDSEEAGVASYFHYIVPVGIDVRYTALDIARVGLFVRACAGMAVNVSDFSSLPPIAQQGLSRLLAQGGAGAGAVIAFSERVGIAIDVMYETFVYFYEEESGGGIATDWIMGFVPSIYLYTRF